MNATPFRSALMALVLAALAPGLALMAVTKPEQNKVRITLGAGAKYPMRIALMSGKGGGQDAVQPDDDRPAMKVPKAAYFLSIGKTVELTFAPNVAGDGAEYIIELSEARRNGEGEPNRVQFAATKPADSGGVAALRWLTLTPKFEADGFALAPSDPAGLAKKKAQIKAMFKQSSPLSSQPSTMDLGNGF